MEEKKFIRVEEVARVLDISESHAYKIMRKLNSELEAKGYITIPRPYITSYPADRRGRIWTVTKFVEYVREAEGL